MCAILVILSKAPYFDVNSLILGRHVSFLACCLEIRELTGKTQRGDLDNVEFSSLLGSCAKLLLKKWKIKNNKKNRSA